MMKKPRSKGFVKTKIQKYNDFIHNLKKMRENQITQGTIEYLTLLALITGISLVIIAVFANMAESPISQISSSSGNLGTMLFGEVAVLETSLDSQGDVAMELKNNGVESITITKIMIGGKEKDVGNSQIGSMGNSKVFRINIAPGDCNCTTQEVGTSKVCDVSVEIVKNSGLTKSSGNQKLSVDCVQEVLE